MNKYMIGYHGGKQPSSREEGMAHKQKWQEWVASLGDKVVNPGTPFTESKLVVTDGVSDDKDPNSLKGFAIVMAENMEEAVSIAKTDPFLAMEGTIRVSEMMEMG